jgi:hypothetical protein
MGTVSVLPENKINVDNPAEVKFMMKPTILKMPIKTKLKKV